MDKFQLEGRRALITGGSRGIGFGIAKAFVDAGADVVLVSRSKEGLEKARNGLTSSGRDIQTVAFDMIRHDEIASRDVRLKATGEAC